MKLPVHRSDGAVGRAVGRPHAAGVLAERGLDCLAAIDELANDLTATDPRELAMTPGVVADRVPSSLLFADHLGVLSHQVPENEERCGDTICFEDLQQLTGVSGHWAVVKGEVDGSAGTL